MTNEVWVAIIGGVGGSVVGSVVGGVISWRLQSSAFQHAASDQAKQRRDRDHGLAYSLLFKVGQIHSHLDVLNRYVENAFKGVKEDELEFRWGILQPMANSPERVLFSAEEMTLILSLKDENIFNELMLKDELHNATIDLFEAYSEKRATFIDGKPPLRMKGRTGTIELTDADRPRVIALNDMVDSIRSHLAGDAAKALELLKRLSALFAAKLGTTFDIKPRADR